MDTAKTYFMRGLDVAIVAGIALGLVKIVEFVATKTAGAAKSASDKRKAAKEEAPDSEDSGENKQKKAA